MNIDPCFFCGSKDIYLVEASSKSITVSCHCHARGPSCGTSVESVNRWNAIAKTVKAAQVDIVRDESVLMRQTNALEEIATVLKFLLKAQDEKVKPS